MKRSNCSLCGGSLGEYGYIIHLKEDRALELCKQCYKDNHTRISNVVEAILKKEDEKVGFEKDS